MVGRSALPALPALAVYFGSRLGPLTLLRECVRGGAVPSADLWAHAALAW